MYIHLHPPVILGSRTAATFMRCRPRATIKHLEIILILCHRRVTHPKLLLQPTKWWIFTKKNSHEIDISQCWHNGSHQFEISIYVNKGVAGRKSGEKC